MARFEQQLVVDELVGDIGRNRILRQARLRRRQAFPECGVGLGDQWIGAPGGGLMRVGTVVQGHNRHYAGTVQVTQRTRGGSATAKSRQRRRREQRQVAGGPGERVGAK